MSFVVTLLSCAKDTKQIYDKVDAEMRVFQTGWKILDLIEFIHVFKRVDNEQYSV